MVESKNSSPFRHAAVRPLLLLLLLVLLGLVVPSLGTLLTRILLEGDLVRSLLGLLLLLLTILLLVAGVDLVKVVAEAAFLVERALGGLFVVVD